MGDQVFTGPGIQPLRDAERAIRKDMKGKERRLRWAVRKAARKGKDYVKRITVPRAYGYLAESIKVIDGEVGESYIVADAEGAAAVENGARPHWMPLEPLIEWVQLRGIQGLTRTGRVVKRSIRHEDDSSIRSVAGALRQKLGAKGAAAWRERENSRIAHGMPGADPATVAVAKAIQIAIAKHGTRPRKYMQRAVAPVEAYLGVFARQALEDVQE